MKFRIRNLTVKITVKVEPDTFPRPGSRKANRLLAAFRDQAVSFSGRCGKIALIKHARVWAYERDGDVTLRAAKDWVEANDWEEYVVTRPALQDGWS